MWKHFVSYLCLLQLSYSKKHALKGSLKGGYLEELVKRVADVENHLVGRAACRRPLVGWSDHHSVRDHQARGTLGSRRSGDIEDVLAEFTERDRFALSSPPPRFSPACATAPAAWQYSPRSAAHCRFAPTRQTWSGKRYTPSRFRARPWWHRQPAWFHVGVWTRSASSSIPIHRSLRMRWRTSTDGRSWSCAAVIFRPCK